MATAHHLLLPLMVSGDDVMGFVRGLGTGHADAGVVGAAVDIQKTFVLLTDLLLQVESGFDQTVRGQRLHLCNRERARNLNVSITNPGPWQGVPRYGRKSAYGQ